MKKIVLSAFLGGIVVLSSCSPKLVGTWAIDSYSVTGGTSNGVNVNNIGTITFNKNNSGEKNISYAIFQNQFEDKTPFRWFNDNNGTVRIEGPQSDFSKTWLVIDDGKKMQVWKSTDGSNQVQELRLKKQK